MKHLFVLNPVAGGKRNDCKALRESIERLMLSSGENYEIYITEGTMDAAEKVKREAIKGETLRVYACGGDGTLSECVHGAAGFKNAAVTHYPCGTGNDFIKTFGQDAKLFTDLKSLTRGDVLPLDIIDVNGRKCIDICSAGIDARVGIDGNKYSSIPLVGGKGAYIISLIVNLFKGINQKFNITGGNGESFSGSCALVCACNGQYYGGGFNPTKEAQPDDGMLDILIVKGVSVFTVAKLIGKYAKGEYYKIPQYITCLRGRKLTVEAENEFAVNIDGEALYTKKAVLKLIPNGVNFIFPENSSFFKTHGKKSAECMTV